jgi:hypothetical protein
MVISHVGNASIHTPMHNHDLILKDVLCVPSAHKNLVSVHRLAKDNKAYLEFHPSFFLIKDQTSKRVILRGRCEGGLYPLPAPDIKAHDKLVLRVQCPSSEVWHSRLGHPAFPIVRHIVQSRNLPYLAESKSQSVCDLCQRAKSYQLPYGVSTSVSTVPFELVFSDVWGPAPTSVVRHDYYVSFIDDFSKYIWIYLLKKKSDVYQVFLNFQNFVERQFQCKIKTMQTNWGGEYEKLNSFFQKIGIFHHISCPRAHQQNGSAERKHGHIVEVGLALLANASMPLKF